MLTQAQLRITCSVAAKASTMQQDHVPALARQRLMKDFMSLHKDPIPYIVTVPLSSNILEWHYVILGPQDSPYDGGLYHGKLLFPQEFPFRPPAVFMITPSGRFRTNTRLCLSISDFHPESWNPVWTVGSILIGLLSFMLEETMAVGTMRCSAAQKRQYAVASRQFNLNDPQFCTLFPAMVEEIRANPTGQSSSMTTT